MKARPDPVAFKTPILMSSAFAIAGAIATNAASAKAKRLRPRRWSAFQTQRDTPFIDHLPSHTPQHSCCACDDAH
jgi:hypothetical protein